MAYFPNASDPRADVLQQDCNSCVLGGRYCPIASVQFAYNYDAEGNETATQILDELVDEETGHCSMLREASNTLRRLP